jgi:hypothetical protein
MAEKIKVEPKKKKDDPCWEGYAMIGTKKKNGKEVPDCLKQRTVKR